MSNSWDYINGESGWDNTVQISPDGKTLLCKESIIEYGKLDPAIKKREVKFYLMDIDTLKKSELTTGKTTDTE